MPIAPPSDHSIRPPFRVLGALLLIATSALFFHAAFDQFGRDGEVSVSCPPGKGQYICEIGKAALRLLPARLHHPFLGLGAAAFALLLAGTAIVLLRPLLLNEDNAQSLKGDKG